MFGFQFIKAGPTTYVLHYKNGTVKREGIGLSLFYFAPKSTIVTVPLASVDVPFVFNQMSADFQALTIQGQLSYRVTDARKLASMLDFSVTRSGRYLSSDPEKLNERLAAMAQVLTSTETQKMRLNDALVAFDTLTERVLKAMQTSQNVGMLGVEILGLSILAISPTPEMAKALEAEARETLQRKSDEAVYARRNAAVEQERLIKESELNTELLVEEKQRQMREAQLTGQIALEERRKELVERQADNDRKQADTRAYALEATLKPVRGMDWRTLMAINGGQIGARAHVAMAFRELAENAQKIGQVNISPDLLDSLLKHDPGDGERPGLGRPKGA